MVKSHPCLKWCQVSSQPYEAKPKCTGGFIMHVAFGWWFIDFSSIFMCIITVFFGQVKQWGVKIIFYDLMDLYVGFFIILVGTVQQINFAPTKNTIWDPTWVLNTKLWEIVTCYQLNHIRPMWYQIKAYKLSFRIIWGWSLVLVLNIKN